MTSKLSIAHRPVGTLVDGRGLLTLAAIGLAASGVVAIALGLSGQLLPHDAAWLGLDASMLCRVAGSSVFLFMVHDRVAFGGTLLAVAVVWLWLILGPLRDGARWAWWAVTASAFGGFVSFLAYLAYGYLDTWHAVATLALLPPTIAGLGLTRRTLGPWARPAVLDLRGIALVARALVVLTAFGMVVAGLTIVTIGSLVVFVPQDLIFLGRSPDALRQLNPHLVPLIAHDRSGFGGAVASTGIAVMIAGVWAPLDGGFRQMTALAGIAGFGAAIGIHFVVGYLDATHLAPAFLGAALLAVGVALDTGRARPASPLRPEGALIAP